MTPGDPLELELDRVAFGGAAVARHEGLVVFVTPGAPGDRVAARVTAVHARHAEAVVERVLRAGAGRVDPVCPAFGRCGGCQWLHLSRATQTEAKAQALADTLTRLGKVAVESWDPPLGAPQGEDLAYRSRAILRGRSHGGPASLGFLAAASREVVPVPGTCRVLLPELDRAVAELASRRWPAGSFKLELTAVGDGRVHAGLQVEASADAYRAALAGFPCRIVDARGRVRHETDPDLRCRLVLDTARGERVLEVRPGSFSQIHHAQNRRLVSRVVEYAAPGPADTVLDLYAGAGNLALPLALVAGRVVGIERSAGAVEDARRNARTWGLTNAEFRRGDVGRTLAVGSLPRPQIVVLDPPRSGAAEALEPLLGLGARRLVYVSCNAATLARDLGRLGGGGYRIARAMALDMFPQTFHVEAVVLLEK